MGAILCALYKAVQVKCSHSWSRTKGEVLESEVVRDVSGDVQGATRTFGARLRYQYIVDGQKFECGTLCVGGELNTGSRQRAQDRCDQYPVGSQVDVYYNPKNPRKACLEQRGEGALILILIGAVFLVIGYCL